MSQESNEERGGGAAVVTVRKTQLKKPNLYKVLLHNDDFTPMDFVVFVLEQVFKRRAEEAVRIMLEVHHKGKGVGGIYTLEIAKTKAFHVEKLAEQQGHPLKCSYEPE